MPDFDPESLFPILFLDIDGVLNSAAWFSAVTDVTGGEAVWPDESFDPENVDALNRITDETGAKIVISSRRRLTNGSDELVDYLRTAGVTGPIVGTTPYNEGAARGMTIFRWVAENRYVTAPMVILDDLPPEVFGPMAPHLVQTDPAVGLSWANAEEAIYELRRKMGLVT
jgi:hypothetical protein